MNLERIDLLIQTALAAAAQKDRGERELGPIHLLKYVYLADLAYADRHGGETFTGVPWRFHHFGPWANEVFQRLDPAANALGAAQRTFASRYREDNRRWSIRDQAAWDRLETRLPGEVSRAVRNQVATFGSDTTSLLHHVYKTRPMLGAAPGELLKFTADSRPTAAGAERLAELPGISNAAAKRLKEKVKAKLAGVAGASGQMEVFPKPRYDQVFAEGVAWLDGLEGPKDEGSGILKFSGEVWKSRARSDQELP